MVQLPLRGFNTASTLHEVPLEANVRNYWESRHELLHSIPDPEIRGMVTALLDGRVAERVIGDVPSSMREGVSMSFSDYDETLAVFRSIYPISPAWTDRFLREAAPYVGVVYYRYMQSKKVKILLENWNTRDSVVTTVLAAAGPWLAVQGLAVVGFTTAGIATGSLAALWQSTIGNVAAGSLFAWLQSIGAVGAIGGPAGIAVGVTTAGMYGAYKWMRKPTKVERFKAMLLTLRQDEGERAKFWASIKV